MPGVRHQTRAGGMDRTVSAGSAPPGLIRPVWGTLDCFGIAARRSDHWGVANWRTVD